jgi:haloalkane dehalogenase
MSTVDWSFSGTWPFAPRFFPTEGGRLHYVDEGPADRPPAVLLQGNPTWAYLYRRFIPPLVEAGYRVVVPDQLGFGRSDKPNAPGLYSVELHTRRLEQLLDDLALGNVTLVVHDWGAALGLRWAVRHPSRVARIFILNASAPRAPGLQGLVAPLRVMRSPGVGELLVQGLDVLTHIFLFRTGVTGPGGLSAEAKRAYLAPHPKWSSRTALLAFPRQVPLRRGGQVSALFEEIEAGLRGHFRDTPVELCWATRDRLLGADVLDEWLRTLPHAGLTRIEGAGHFLQEDAPDEVVAALLSFLTRSDPMHRTAGGKGKGRVKRPIRRATSQVETTESTVTTSCDLHSAKLGSCD